MSASQLAGRPHCDARTRHGQPARSASPLAALVAALILAGCASPHGIAPQTTTPDPAQMQLARPAGVEAAPVADGWLALAQRDPQFAAALAEARAASPSLTAAAARVRSAMAAAGLAEAAQGPNVDLQLAYDRQRISLNNPMFPAPLGGEWYPLYRTGLSVQYVFDWWGQFAAEERAAQAQVEVARAEARDADRLLAHTLAAQYVTLGDAITQRDLARAELAALERRAALTRQQVTAGIAPADLAANINAQRDQKKAEIASLDQSVAKARHALAALAGKGPDAFAALTPAALPAASAVALPAQPTLAHLAARPDGQAARDSVTAAAEGVKSARAAFYPTVSLTGFAGVSAGHVSDLLKKASGTYDIMPAISLPIFDGGALRAQLGSRAARFDLANAEYTRTLINAARDGADAMVTVQASSDARRQADAVLGENARAASIARARAAGGIAPVRNALEAELARLQGERSARHALAQEWLARMDAARALGA